MAKIQAEEQALVEHLGSIVPDLHRRIRVRKAKRKWESLAMDQNEIINKRVPRIARDHGCSVAEVNTALDHHPIELERDKFLRRTLAMELVELDGLQQAFREKALVDHDTAAGGS